jgi:perosamine synthetase
MTTSAVDVPIEFPTWPHLADEDIAAVVDVLRSSRLSQLSSHAVSNFEDLLASFVGRQHAVVVNSGTAAVHTALAALDIGAGDEVVVPSHTFIGSASPIVHQGAIPVFADVDDQTYCLCPESLNRAISPRTKAIVAVHLNGASAPMDEISAIAAARGIPVIEDVAQAIGGSYRGRPLGSMGELAAFSFWEDKIITTGGEGGAVLTDDAELAARMRRFRHHGEHRPPGARTYGSIEIGHNYRLTAMQAALGTSQLRRIDAFLAVRQNNAQALTKGLSDVSGLRVPRDTPQFRHAYWKYVCRVPSGAEDEELLGRITGDLQRWGVPAFRRYPLPLHRQPAFERIGLGGQECPVSDRLAQELFSLPVHPLITDDHLKYMIDSIATVLADYA